MDKIHSFKPIDSITDPNEVINYPNEFVNSLNLPGLPLHHLQLKVGSVIIMLRNLNQPKLWNRTRLTDKNFMKNLIEATIIIAEFKGEAVLIPRIPLMPTAFEENPVKKLTLLRPEESRRAGRPKLTWLDGVEEDLGNLSIRGWRRRVLDRDRWKDVLTAARAQNGL